MIIYIQIDNLSAKNLVFDYNKFKLINRIINEYHNVK